MARDLIVSNRLPVTVDLDGDDVELRPSAGGLASALAGVHARGESLWLGWPGDLGRASAAARAHAADALHAQRLVPIELSASEVSRYYDGLANGVLWPLFHYLTDVVRRDPGRDWAVYREVNERFASAIAATWRPGDRIWIHDYHLMLVPGLVRRRLPDAAIGFFLHIPFPAAEVFRILPWREELLRGVLGADLVGLHTADYAHQVRYAATQLVGAEEHGDELTFEDRRVRVGAYPIGIDAHHNAALADAPEVVEQAATWKSSARIERLVLGVDRLDYTKGLPRRLLAFERLLERWPAWRERVQLVQLAVPTRERSAEYDTFRRDVNELVGRINGRFGTPVWTPIQFMYRSVSATELAALYRAADVMLVTPLRDGMNLVAKEYCASRTDEHGVLVLSELAGAAAELREALLVNPYDVDGTAGAIRRALEMSAPEQQARMVALRGTVFRNDVRAWAGRFLDDLDAAHAAGPVIASGASTPLDAALAVLRAAPQRALLLDYDGTLVSFASMPELAFPDEELRTLLRALGTAGHTEVHLVSGRSRTSLDAWFGDLPIGLCAEHGYWLRPPGGAWEAVADAAPEALATAQAVMARACARTPGSFVEAKGSSLAWHYRMVEPRLAARRTVELREHLSGSLPASLALLDGAKVLEVRVRGVDKGGAVRRILGEPRADRAVLIAGDDRTDEDMFAAAPPGAITLRVGAGASGAAYRVDGPDDVRALLRGLR